MELTLSVVHVGLSGVRVHGHLDLEQPIQGQLAEAEDFLEVGRRVAAGRVVQRGCHRGGAGRSAAAADGAAQRQWQLPAGRRRRQSRRGQSQTQHLHLENSVLPKSLVSLPLTQSATIHTS